MSLRKCTPLSITHTTDELVIDTIGSLIPGVARAVSSYRRIRAEKNLKELINHLQKRYEQVLNNLYKQTVENRNKLDKLLEFIIDIVVEEYQEEKIKYMANGYLNLTEHIDVSDDFVMHYYDVIKQLRVVDISVLRLNSRQKYHIVDNGMKETYQDVLDRHNISIEQYKFVRESLLRKIGLRKIDRLNIVKLKFNRRQKKILKQVNLVWNFITFLLMKWKNDNRRGRYFEYRKRSKTNNRRKIK